MKCSHTNIFCKGAENKINFLGLIFPRMPTDTYYFWEVKKNFAQEMTDLDEETSKATHILPYIVPCTSQVKQVKANLSENTYAMFKKFSLFILESSLKLDEEDLLWQKKFPSARSKCKINS